MTNSICIIGAGVAGLSAGCYGRMNGFDTRIYEMGDKPGGLCTSWRRQGYTFDGCIHWLVGSGADSAVNRMWRELGALQGRQIVNHDEFRRTLSADGRIFSLYTDIDRLERHLIELAPGDAPAIRRFCRLERRFVRISRAIDAMDMAQSPLAAARARLRMLPRLPTVLWAARTSVMDYVARFRDPFLRRALGSLFNLPDFPMLGMLMTLAWMHRRDAGYPIGGSLAFAGAIERRYRDLGGELHYGARVEEILVEGDRAVGVRLADGREERADWVISAADGHTTIFRLLGGRFLDERIRGYYKTLPVFPPLIQISLGVARDLSHEPQAVLYPLSKPLHIAGEARHSLGVRHFGYDPGLAPPGKSSVLVTFPSNYAYWEALKAPAPEGVGGDRYEAEKQAIAAQVLGALEARYPGIRGQIEALDVATPLTYARYTGNWQGSMEGWLLTTRTSKMMLGPGMPNTLPGLTRFLQAGHWVTPGGGLPNAARSGRRAIRDICQAEGRPFRAERPSQESPVLGAG